VKSLHAFLFDVYPQGHGLAVWFLDRDGRAHCLRDSLSPAFYAAGPRKDLRDACLFLKGARAPVSLRRVEKHDLFLGCEIELLEVTVHVPAQFGPWFRRVHEFRPGLTYYNADISIPQLYVFERGVFPLAFCQVDYDPDSRRILGLETSDSPWDLDYDLPPLRVLTLRLSGELTNPNHAAAAGPALYNPAATTLDRVPLEDRVNSSHLLLESDGRTYAFDRRRGKELLLGVKHVLEQYDPDLLLSAWGDSYILPRLLELSQHYGIPLPLSRDPGAAPARRPSRSYFSYGKVIYKAEQHTLFGRWHIDRENAFLSDDYGLDGMLELARITQLPVQTVARVSTGTGISAMQVATAYRRNVVIPWQKREPEAMKSALDLIASDKGGLVYQPLAGLHEHVAELDFSAMYPSIMVEYNISPETVGCTCCDGEPVPEIEYPVCTRRQGLVPETLAPLVAKRSQYKKLIRRMATPALAGGAREDDPVRERYRRRYSAHKWLLVTCFGYLGYKNARFGKIEAHESVTAYGREILLRAKELVEDRGFRVLHLYVDSLWIHKPGATSPPDYDDLIEEISAATKVSIVLEGIYRWVAFLPSRVDPRQPVANRYFGAFQDGEIKLRGIEARRRDTVAWVREAQVQMIEMLAEAQDVQEYREKLSDVLTYARGKLEELRSGQVPARELVITNHLSRLPQEFKMNTVNARVARQLAAAGVSLSPGEAIKYVLIRGPERAAAWELMAGTKIPNPKSKIQNLDLPRYTELFLRALDTLVAPLGVNRATLELWLHNAGYWGPPGQLPPPGVPLQWPLLGWRAGKALRVFDLKIVGPYPIAACPAPGYNKRIEQKYASVPA